MDSKKRVELVKSAMLSLQRFEWEQGTATQAILEWDGLTTEVYQLCESAVLRSGKDGRVGNMGHNGSTVDPASIGEALLESAKATGNESWKKAADKLYFYLKYRAPKTTDGILYHFNNNHQIWVDGYYMSPPFLCKYGDVDEAIKQIKGYRKYLYHEDAHLLSHQWDDDLGEFARELFWGVGNGWALAGLSRVIGMLGEEHKEDREYLIAFLQELLDGCLKYQREDGLFHDILDDPTSFVDTNVSQMIAYTIYRGLERGYLSDDYLPVAEKIREAVQGKVDEYGFVRDVCGMPNFNSPGVATEGQAFYILMEAAARDYNRIAGKI